MELLVKPPNDIKVPPTILAKRTREEEMESYFFRYYRAENTTVVISL
jgi:hypothetical protein